ncbi:MAG: aldolase/citrate lyase family protein [Planctomycetota bacterium]|nr:aldolase/citrate lyase family protein [Planctomycetota bacterium]
MPPRLNRVKEKLSSGQTAMIVGGTDDADHIDQLCQIGFDGIWLEGEHGPVDFKDIGNLTRACDLWGATSIVRVNQNEQGLIYRTLDRGAQGIVVPHVNTKEEAENVVAGGKFPPAGLRGMFTSRQGFGVEDYFVTANDQTLLVILIEDIIAVQNLDAILTVDNIDVFFVAPADLAASMGHIGELQHPEVIETIDGALKKIIEYGRTAGTLVNNSNVEKFASAGVRMLYTVQWPWIEAGAKEFRSQVEKGTRNRK